MAGDNRAGETLAGMATAEAAPTGHARVDAYIAALPPLRAERLAALRGQIHEVAPGIVEDFDWKMPVFRMGERWVAVASQKSYISVYLGCEARAAAVIASDPRLKGGKSCVNIPDRADLPLATLGPAVAATLAKAGDG
jgi:hypothetical protein